MTGWIVLAGEPPFAHRPDPDNPEDFMCRLAITAGYPLLITRPLDANECGRCALAISRARKKARRAQARLRHDRTATHTAVDLEQNDQRDRARQRGTSV